MNIDIENAKMKFLEYTQNYDLQNEHIKRKQLHSLRVMQVAKEISEKLNLNENQIQLASLMGLLHDIGRFEQYKQFNTFIDQKSFDHGDYGEKILEKDMRKYIKSDEYDDIIKKVVRNHNKFQIESGLTEEEMFFAKLIRDADKIDIMYESIEIFWKGNEDKVENSIISKDLIELFRENKTINFKKNIQGSSPIEDVLSIIGYVFDINYKMSFEILKEKDYVNKILNRYNIKDEYTKTTVEEIRNIINDYIDRNVKI